MSHQVMGSWLKTLLFIFGFGYLKLGIVIFSPFYHYRELLVWSANLDNNPVDYLGLHILWLIWTGIFLSFITIWAYKRDKIVQ
ncbi:MAG: hypothetical protein QNJ42_06685 [Crocosphaera sp.]|nr:hypothetical protein [Crocosphaera sp.]